MVNNLWTHRLSVSSDLLYFCSKTDLHVHGIKWLRLPMQGLQLGRLSNRCETFESPGVTSLRSLVTMDRYRFSLSVWKERLLGVHSCGPTPLSVPVLAGVRSLTHAQKPSRILRCHEYPYTFDLNFIRELFCLRRPFPEKERIENRPCLPWCLVPW